MRGKTGLPPGALVFTGKRKVESPFLTVYYYNADDLQTENKLPSPSQVSPENVLWLDVRGLHEIELVEKTGKQFKLHALALEDILDIRQRPKFEEYKNEYFMILRLVSFDKEKLRVSHEQISIYGGTGFVLTFQEDSNDSFAHVRSRVDQAKGRIRTRGSDYLAYALADNIVDKYFVTLDKIGDEIDKLEVDIVNNTSPEIKSRIHSLKRCTLVVRRAISPLRELVSRYSKAESSLIEESTRIYIRDLYDHVLQANEIIEAYRDTLSGLNDLYISEISFRMNRVMQVLTIVASIFIPLTFLAGIYGMNFTYMPELQWKYGYFVLLGIMALTTLGLIFFFKWKKWL